MAKPIKITEVQTGAFVREDERAAVLWDRAAPGFDLWPRLAGRKKWIVHR